MKQSKIIAQTNRKDDFMTRTNNRNNRKKNNDIPFFSLSLYSIWTVNQRSNAHVINTQLSTLIENESSPHQTNHLFSICFHEIYIFWFMSHLFWYSLLEFNSFGFGFTFSMCAHRAPLHFMNFDYLLRRKRVFCFFFVFDGNKFDFASTFVVLIYAFLHLKFSPFIQFNTQIQ